MTKQRERVIWLVILEVVYLLAWIILESNYPKLGDEWPQLVMSAPFLYMAMLLIVEAGKWEEGDTT